MKQSPAVVSRATEPVSLLSQYKLLRAVIDAPWATRLDMRITSHVIDRYRKDRGNSRVSIGYLEVATSATPTNIVESLRRIADNGVISVARIGAGTRPTEYDLDFDFSSKISSPPVDGSTTSPPVHGSTSTPVHGSTTASSPPVDGSESYLRSLPTGRLTESRTDTHATASPPPVGGPEATTAGTARDPEKAGDRFEELWTVYPRKEQRQKAKVAYKALRPSAVLHATLVERATAWSAHYDATATDKKWWKHLHTWLEGECWLEDLPVPYENAKEAAIARKRENGPRAGKPQPAEKEIGLSRGIPIGRHKVKIVASEVTGDSFDAEKLMKFEFRIEDGQREGKEFSHAFNIVSADETTQTKGQAIWAQLRRATGKLEPFDTCDLHGLPLLAIHTGMGRIEYAAV